MEVHLVRAAFLGVYQLWKPLRRPCWELFEAEGNSLLKHMARAEKLGGHDELVVGGIKHAVRRPPDSTSKGSFRNSHTNLMVQSNSNFKDSKFTTCTDLF